MCGTLGLTCWWGAAPGRRSWRQWVSPGILSAGHACPRRKTKRGGYQVIGWVYRGLETYEYEHGEWLLLLAAGLGVDPVDAVEEDLREEVVPLGGPDPGLARARGWVGGRVGLGHTHGWGQWSLVTASALLRGVFIFISVLWRPSPQCPSVAQPLCPQTCRHADTSHYGTSWIFATLVYSMNVIKRLHI